MALEDSLRYSEYTGGGREWPREYRTQAPADNCNWSWLALWEQNNPAPPSGITPESEQTWSQWYAQYLVEQHRVWVQSCLPGFKVWEWSAEDVEAARALLAGKVCGVCGRAEDPGCVLGC